MKPNESLRTTLQRKDMFGLAAGLYQQYVQKPTFQFLVLGLDNAGKTTCLEQMKALYGPKRSVHPQQPHKTRPTIGLNVARLEVGAVKLLVWDLGGQTSLRVIWDKYYPEAHALVYVVDAADTERLEESHQELEQLLAHPDLEGAPVLILANKQDLHTSVSGEEMCRLISFDVSSISSRRSIRVQDISALRGQGLDVGIRWLLDAARRSSRAVSIV